MKKIQRLSLYKKKKVHKSNDVPDSFESEQTTRSPLKSPFSQTLRKKFFSGKGVIRSLSLPEGAKQPTFNASENFLTLDSNDVFIEETSTNLNGSTSASSERLSHCDNTKDFSNSGKCTPQPDFSRANNNVRLTANGPVKDALNSINCSVEEVTETLPHLETNASVETGFSPYGCHSVVENDHVYDLPSNTPPLSSSSLQEVSSSFPSSLKEQLPANFTADMRLLSYTPQPQLTARYTLTAEFKRLAMQGWYWGPITRTEAEEKLQDTPNGSFLVRDSADERYLLSLSFRSFGRTLHTRIEYNNGNFSFYSNSGPQSYTSVVDLITDSVRDSEASGVFCYSRSRAPMSPTLPVFLTNPVSRFSQVRSLQYLCRFVVRQYTRIDHIEKLPLPVPVKGYLNQPYF